MAKYHVGVDIGGTFTDCVVIDERGQLTAAKSPSTPPHFANGMLGAMEVAAQRLGLDMPSFCASIRMLTHGTTVGTDARENEKDGRRRVRFGAHSHRGWARD